LVRHGVRWQLPVYEQTRAGRSVIEFAEDRLVAKDLDYRL
jgi:hypothetical protein